MHRIANWVRVTQFRALRAPRRWISRPIPSDVVMHADHETI